MSQIIPIYIPTYISDQNYSPSRVQPRILFYNGQVDCQSFYVKNQNNVSQEVKNFPYFDNYNVSGSQFPTTGSKSLLFFNEAASYGETPTDSLYSEYWSTYVSLLYSPRTRLLNASAIIPLADYFKMELNDIVEFRGNYYHLRAINDYNLKNGECDIQLLGPILGESLNLPTRYFEICYGYDETNCDAACYYSCQCTNTCPEPGFTFSSIDASDFSFDISITGSYTLALPTQTATGNQPDGTYYKTLYTASWGDGTESYVSGQSDFVNATHTYSTPGTYTITLSGQCANFGNTEGNTSPAGIAMATLRNVITKVNSWGSMNFSKLCFDRCYRLSQIPDGEPGLYSVLTFVRAFSGLNQTAPPIGTIPPNLFKYCHNAGNNVLQPFTDMFYGNQSITAIPERLFYYCPNAGRFEGTFFGCLNLTTLPNELFAPIPNRTTSTGFVNIGSMFRACRSITSIPPNMFDPITGSISNPVTWTASNTFLMNTTTNALTGNAPELWNSPNASFWFVTGFFRNCVNLTNYSSIPGGWL